MRLILVLLLLAVPALAMAQSDPSTFPLVSICDTRVDDSGDCITDAVDDTVCVEGIVLAWKEYGSRGPGAIYDPVSGCAIGVFDINNAPDIPAGTLVRVCGWVGNFAGLAELTDEPGNGNNDPVITVLDPGPLPLNPVPVNAADLADDNPLAEQLESRLVQLCGRFEDSGDFLPFSANYVFTDLNGDAVEIRIDSDTGIQGTPIPEGYVTVLGVLSQFNVFQDECIGYQVLPRSLDDFLAPTCTVDLDMHPTSCPNPINVQSQGLYPVAILGSPSLDVSSIDPSTIQLEGVSPTRWSLDDVSAPWTPPNLLMNPSFETPDASLGDVYGTSDWGGFNDHFTTAFAAHTGMQSLKIFGPFFPFGGAGVVQSVGAASEGDVFMASAWALNSSADPIDPSNFATVKIEFLDAGNNVIGFAESPQITSAIPLDTWTQFSVTATAPANTVSAQLVLVHVQLEPITGGSVFFDDASMTKLGKPECACSTAGPDGYTDLTLKFSNQALVAALGTLVKDTEVPVTITGSYMDGTPFMGEDCVIVRGRQTADRAGRRLQLAISRAGLQATTVSYFLSEQANVRLSVYNVAGRLVETLVDAVQPAGQHGMQWNSGEQPSGVYLFHLQVGQETETRKFVLMN